MQNASYEDIVQNIKDIIAEKGVKQSFIAEKAGFNSSEFSNMLNDRRKLIRVEHIPRIAKALDVGLDALFKPKEPNKESK